MACRNNLVRVDISAAGHSRLKELVLGGVSRNLRADPPMRLLVSH